MIWMARSLGIEIMLGCMIEKQLRHLLPLQYQSAGDYPDSMGNL